MSGAVNVTSSFAYDALGNISSKSDVGGYIYNASGLNSVRPHAVANITGTVNGTLNPTFTYDANGNLLTGAGRSITWSSFNIPSQISNQTPNGIKTAAFWYNPEHERIKELQADQSVVITLSPRYDTGLHFEKRYLAANGQLTGAVEYEHYLYAGGLMFGKFITTTATDGITLATTSIEYYSKDHLGSIVAITDATGTVTQRLSYDVWGKRRYPNGAADPNGLLNNPDMYHGFTGHEMLDSVGLIHMNGRLYDPVMARFVSADFLIQSPDNLQSYNRYSYCVNNPLNLTDPSGQSWWTSLRDSVIRPAVAIAVAVYMPGYGGAFLSGLISSGGDIKAGLLSMATAGMFNAVGGMGLVQGSLESVVAHGMVGGISSSLAGGNFGSGFVSGAFTQAFAPTIDGIDRGTIGPSLSRTMVAAVVGGTGSVLSGGKFANGAITGAFSRLYNDDQHQKALFKVDRFAVGGGASMSVWTLSVNGNELASGVGIEPAGFGGPGFDRVAAGEYELNQGYSKHFGRDLWGVPDAVADGSGRAMDKVWIHSGNYASQTQGCYMPGAGFSSPGVITGSKLAVNRIDSILSNGYVSSRKIQYKNN